MKFKDIKGKEYDIPISSIDGVKKFDLNGEMIYPIEIETAPWSRYTTDLTLKASIRINNVVLGMH